MTDFLGKLAAQALGHGESVEPRRPSLNEQEADEAPEALEQRLEDEPAPERRGPARLTEGVSPLRPGPGRAPDQPRAERSPPPPAVDLPPATLPPPPGEPAPAPTLPDRHRHEDPPRWNPPASELLAPATTAAPAVKPVGAITPRAAVEPRTLLGEGARRHADAPEPERTVHVSIGRIEVLSAAPPAEPAAPVPAPAPPGPVALSLGEYLQRRKTGSR
jgi:hypothetical protein